MILTWVVQSVSSYSCLKGFSDWYYDPNLWTITIEGLQM